MKKDKLAAKIWAAFAYSEYPGDENLVYKTYESHLGSQQIIQHFRGKVWAQISFETLLSNQLSLPFFTPQAFRYYLPAYLLGCVLQFKKADTIPDTIISSLTPPPCGEAQILFEETMRGFTAEQKSAINAYLEYMAEYHGKSISRFLEDYWGKE